MRAIFTHLWLTGMLYGLLTLASFPVKSQENEPNNSAGEANQFTLNTTINASIGALYDQDWFMVTIPEEGILKFISTGVEITYYYLYMINVDGTSTLMTTSVTPLGETDSVYQTNLQAGTYYIKVNPYAQETGAYTLTNRFTPAVLPNDQEPNNLYTQAQELGLNGTVTGRLNYVYGGTYDNSDWYKIITPEEGMLKIYTSSPDDNYYYLRLYDVNGQRLLSSTNVSPAGETDSVFQTNLQAGTYFVQLAPYAFDHGSYTLYNHFQPALLPGDLEPNDSWQASTPIDPNSTVTGRLNYVYDLSYDNQDWYKITMPARGGLKISSFSTDNWYYYVRLMDVNGTTVLATGSAFDYDTCLLNGINLEEGSTYYIHIYPYSTYCGSYTLSTEFIPAPAPGFTIHQNLMNVLFTNTSLGATTYHWDFGDGSTSAQVNPSHTYASPGAYEVTLSASNFYGTSSATGFAEFRGIQKIESNRGGNNGKATITIFAGGLNTQSIPYLRIGATEIQGEQILFPKYGQIQALFNLDGAELGLYDMVIKNPGEPEIVLEQAYTVEQGREPEVWVEVNGRGKGLINRWCTWSVDIGNRGNTDAFYRILWLAVPDSVRFTNLNFDLSLFNDPESEEYLADCPPYWELDTIGTEPYNGRLYGIMLNKIPANSKFNIEFQIKTITDFEIIAFTTTPWFTEEDYSRTMSYHECIAWAVATIIRDKLVEQLTDLIPGSDCIYNSIKSLSEITLAYYSDKLTVPSGCWAITQLTWKCLKDLGHVLPWWEAYEVAWTMAEITMDIIEAYNMDSDCQDYKKKEVKKKVVKAVNSYDPNEIEGPQGFTDNHYIRDKEAPYTVFFENQATATSNALEVFITDELDSEKYDLGSFRFERIWIAGSSYDVLMDGDGFAMDVDLRPRLNTIARVSGTFNPATGKADWHFISLDPSTMAITEDPDAGFLPPNSDKPEGEGAVSYSVNLKSSLGHNDPIDARASIVFDFNEPILTNVFTNIIDHQPPVSLVYGCQPVGEGGVYEISWQATDAGAGVDYYNVYRSTGQGEFMLWRNNMEGTSDTMTAEPGTAYSFFCQAVDNLGNMESYKGYAETGLGIEDAYSSGITMEVVPNPASSYAIIQIGASKPVNLQIELANSHGQIMYASGPLSYNSGKQSHAVDVSRFGSGLYLVMIKTQAGILTKKLVIDKE